MSDKYLIDLEKKFKMPWEKRLFDIIVSSLLLLLLLPIFAIIAIGIKLSSKGPVFSSLTELVRIIKFLNFINLEVCVLMHI